MGRKPFKAGFMTILPLLSACLAWDIERVLTRVPDWTSSHVPPWTVMLLALCLLIEDNVHSETN